MSTTRHIFLTGPPGIGKTTLIKNVCEKLQQQSVSVQGFYTEELRSGGRRTGFDVVTLDGGRGALARVSDDSVPSTRKEYRVGQYSVRLQSFEQTALPTLKNRPPGSIPVLVIDEVGKMELFSQSFVKTVKELLNQSGTTILATIPVPKQRPIPFVEELRSRPDAQVFTISRENRNNIIEQIISAVLSSHKTYGKKIT